MIDGLETCPSCAVEQLSWRSPADHAAYHEKVGRLAAVRGHAFELRLQARAATAMTATFVVILAVITVVLYTQC